MARRIVRGVVARGGGVVGRPARQQAGEQVGSEPGVLQTGQQGNYIYVVKPDRTVEQRPVVPGPRIDTSISITQGIAAGETVVTEGQLRLVPGMKVKVL